MNNIMNNIFAIGKTGTFGNKPINGLFDILPDNSEKGIADSENSFKGFIESFANKLVSHNNPIENNQAIGKENFIELNDRSPMNLHLYKLENSSAKIDNPISAIEHDVIDASELTFEPGHIKSGINNQIENGNFVKEEIRSSVDSSKNPQFDSNISNLNSGVEKNVSQESPVIPNNDPNISEKNLDETLYLHENAQSNISEDSDTGLNKSMKKGIEKESNISSQGIEIKNTESVFDNADSEDDIILGNDFDIINPEFVDQVVMGQTPVDQTVSVSNNEITEPVNTQEGRFGEYVIDARLAPQKGRNTLFEKIVSSDEYKELAEQIELVKNTDDILSRVNTESKFAQQITARNKSVISNEIPDQVKDNLAKYGLDMNSSGVSTAAESSVRNDNRAGLLFDNPDAKGKTVTVDANRVTVDAGGVSVESTNTQSMNTEGKGISVNNIETQNVPESQSSQNLMGKPDNIFDIVESPVIEQGIQFSDRNTTTQNHFQVQNNAIQSPKVDTAGDVTLTNNSYAIGDENSSVYDGDIASTQAENNMAINPETGEVYSNGQGMGSGRMPIDQTGIGNSNIQSQPGLSSEIIDSETGEVIYSSESSSSSEMRMPKTSVDPNTGELISKQSNIQNGANRVDTIEQATIEALENGSERIIYDPETGEVITQSYKTSEKPEQNLFADTKMSKTDMNAQAQSRAKFAENARNTLEFIPQQDDVNSYQVKGERVQTEGIEQLNYEITEDKEKSIFQPDINSGLPSESNIENTVREQDRFTNKNDFPKLNNISEQKQTALIDEDSPKSYAFNEVMEPNNRERDFYSDDMNVQKSNNAVESLHDSSVSSGNAILENDVLQNTESGTYSDIAKNEIENGFVNDQTKSYHSFVSDDKNTGYSNTIEQSQTDVEIFNENKTGIQSIENQVSNTTIDSANIDGTLRESTDDVLQNVPLNGESVDSISNGAFVAEEDIINDNTSKMNASNDESSGNPREHQLNSIPQRESTSNRFVSNDNIESEKPFVTNEESFSSTNDSSEKPLNDFDLNANINKENSSRENTPHNDSTIESTSTSENIFRDNQIISDKENVSSEKNISRNAESSEIPLSGFESHDNSIEKHSLEEHKTPDSISQSDFTAKDSVANELSSSDSIAGENTVSENTVSENTARENIAGENTAKGKVLYETANEDYSINRSDTSENPKISNLNNHVPNAIDSSDYKAEEKQLNAADPGFNNDNPSSGSVSFNKAYNENLSNDSSLSNESTHINVSSDTIQTDSTHLERTQTENIQAENAHLENAQKENAHLENTQAENAQIEVSQIEVAKTEIDQNEISGNENVQIENAQIVIDRNENSHTENAQNENIQTKSFSQNNAQSDSIQSKKSFNNSVLNENGNVENVSENDSSLAENVSSEKNVASDFPIEADSIPGINNSETKLNIEEIDHSVLFTPSEEMVTETGKFGTSLEGENIDEVIEKYYNIERKTADSVVEESKVYEQNVILEDKSSDKISSETIETNANNTESDVSINLETTTVEHSNTEENVSEDVQTFEAKKNTKINPGKKSDHIINDKDIEEAREELEIDSKKAEIPEKEIRDSYIKRKPKVESTFDIKAEQPEQSLSGTSDLDSRAEKTENRETPNRSAIQDAVERAKLRRANIQSAKNIGKTETEYSVKKTHISGKSNVPHSESLNSNPEETRVYNNETEQDGLSKPGVNNTNGGISGNSDRFVDKVYVQEEAKTDRQSKTELTGNNQETSSDKNINLADSQNKENNAANDDWQKKLLNFENIRKFSKGAISDSDYQTSKNGSETEKTISDSIENEIGRVMNSSDIKWRIKNMSNNFDTQDKKVESKSSLEKVNIDVSTQEAPVLKREVVDSQMSKENGLPLSSLPMRERVNNVQYDSEYESLGNRDSVFDSSFVGIETPEGKAGTYEGGYSDLTEKINTTGLGENNTFIGNNSFDKVVDSNFEALEPEQIEHNHNEHIENPDMASYEQFDKLTYIAPQNPSKHGELKHNPSNYQMSELFRNSNPSQTAVSGTEYSAQVIGNSNEVSSMKPDDNGDYRNRKKAEVEETERITEPLSYRDNFAKVTSPKEAYRTNSEGESDLLESRDRTAVQDNVVNDSLSQNNNMFNATENAQSVSSVNNGKIANSVDDIFGSLLRENSKDIKPSALEILDLTTDWLRSQNDMEGKMALNDSVLGEINVHFKTEGDKLRVRFEVAAKGSKEQLLTGVDNFRKVMSKDGYNEVTVDIDHHDNSGENQSAHNNSEQNMMGNHGQTGNGSQGYRGNKRFRKNQFEAANSNQNYSVPHIMGQLRNETATMHVVA